MNPELGKDRISRLIDTVRRAAAGDDRVRVGNHGNGDALDRLSSGIDELLDSIEPRITACRQELDALHEAQDQYRRLEANIQGMVYTYCLHPDGSFSFPYVNAASRELFDVEPEAIMRDGALIAGLIHPDDRERREASILRSAKTLAPWREELRHIVNGEVRWYDCISRPEIQSNGDILWTGVILEITQRKRSEEALRESEARYRRLHESMIDAFAAIDVSGRIQESNRSFQALVGYSEEELRQLTYNDLTPEKWHRFEAEILTRQVMTHGYSQVYEKEYRKKDGSIIPVELRVFMLRDPAGLPAGMWAIVRDITERKRGEEALRRETAFNQSVIERASEGIVVCHAIEEEPGVRFTVWNSRMGEITGCSMEEVNRSGWPPMVCSDTGARDGAVASIEQIRPGDDLVAAEWTITRKDGTKRLVEVTTSLLQSDDGPVHVLGLMNDVTERRNAERRLRERNTFIEAVLEQLPVGVAVTRDRVAQYVNRRFVEIHGWPEEFLMTGQMFGEPVFPAPHHREEISQRLYSDLESRDPSQMRWEDLRVTTADGEERAVTVAAIQLKDTPEQVIYVTEDITERVRAKRAIEEANSQLEQSLSRARNLALEASQASRAKSAFVANISHEIRTPLSGVIGMAELLLETNLSGEQQEFADTIQGSARTLLALLNDILDFSKIEAGKLELETLNCDLHVTFEEVCDLLGFSVMEKGLDLVCLLEPGVPSLLRCDAGRLRQVLVNLVGNAVKFTERGEVRLLVSLEREDPEEATLRFSVSDTGIGIESESLAQLFQPFNQADASTTRRYGGTGLGLSICRGLVDLMGGELQASSEIGVGSTFWFTLTLAKQAGEIEGRETVQEPLIGLRVLVADDSAANRHLVKCLADSWGCRCAEADSGQQAIDMLRAAADQGDPFRVAILDAEMPGMGSEEMCDAVRNDARLAEIRLLPMRSIGRDQQYPGGCEASLVSNLPKPVRRSHLKRALLAAVRGAPGIPEVASLARLDESVRLAQQRPRVLVAEDNLVNRKVLTGLLEKLGCRAVGVTDGREALRALGMAHYDLVLMDCQMPVMDGYQATREIRDPQSNVLDHEVPIVAVTAHAIMGEQEKCLGAGMNGYLAKPVSFQTLADAIRSWVGEAGGPPSE